jgi:hypothetical protein
MFGAFEAGSPAQILATIPEIAWEASLGIYLIAKGFKTPSGVLDQARDAGVGSATPAVAAA